MTCRCTCGKCDCPQIKVTHFPDYGAAPAVGLANKVDWGLGNAAAANPISVTIRFDQGAAAAMPLLRVMP